MPQQSAPDTQPGLEEVKRQFEHWRDNQAQKITKYHLETEDRHGSKLKMQLRGPDLPDLQRNFSSFLSFPREFRYSDT